MLATALSESRASIVFHLAAQAIVAEGYRFARDTFASNLTGTVCLTPCATARPSKLRRSLPATSATCPAGWQASA